MKAEHEVNMRDLVENYKANNHHIDCYIKDLSLCIELHGQQHAKPVAFGGEFPILAQEKFIRGRSRDRQKAQALIEAGYTYIVIWFDEPITEDLIIAKIKEFNAQEPKD